MPDDLKNTIDNADEGAVAERIARTLQQSGESAGQEVWARQNEVVGYDSDQSEVRVQLSEDETGGGSGEGLASRTDESVDVIPPALANNETVAGVELGGSASDPDGVEGSVAPRAERLASAPQNDTPATGDATGETEATRATARPTGDATVSETGAGGSQPGAEPASGAPTPEPSGDAGAPRPAAGATPGDATPGGEADVPGTSSTAEPDPAPSAAGRDDDAPDGMAGTAPGGDGDTAPAPSPSADATPGPEATPADTGSDSPAPTAPVAPFAPASAAPAGDDTPPQAPAAINGAPTAIALDATDVDENADGAVIGNLSTTDPDVGDTFTYTVDDSRFEVVDGQLKLKDGQSLDAEAAPTIDVTVISTDSAGASTQQTFTLNVADLNEGPTGIVLDATGVDENADGAVIGNLSTTDPDVGDSFTYTVDDARFEVVDGQLKLKDGQSLDAETAASLDVTVTSTDSGGASTQQTFTLNVADLNEGPTAIALDATDVDENDSGAVIGNLSTTDPDVGDTFTYTVDDARFEVVDGQLKLKDGQSLDAEAATTVDVTVTSTDSGGASTQQTFTLNVADLNEGPTAIALDATDVDENDSGAVIGNLSTTDPDVGDSFTYTVDDARFEVVDGQLKLKDGQSLDAETAASLDVTVTSTDSGGASTQQTFTLDVADLNEGPTAIALDATDVDENDSGAVIGNLSTTDPDVGDSLTYTVDDARFEVVDGQLKLKDGQSLDAETAASLDVTVTSTDSGGASTQQTFTLNVADLNEGPTAITLDATDVDENDIGAVIGNLSTTDPDVGDSFTYTVDDARFEVIDGQFKLKDGQSLDAEAAASLDVTVTSTDSGGASTQQTFTLDVADLNEGPTAIALDATDVDENDIGAVIGNLSTTDPDVGDSFTYTVDDARFEVIDGQLKLKDGQSLDAETATSLDVTVTSTDSGGASTQQTFTLNVADLNEGPTAIALDATDVDENADGAVIGNLSTTDPDVGDTFTYTVDDARFEVVDGQLKLKDSQSLDAETAASLDVTVTSTDSGGASTQQTFTLNVADLNEGPTAIALDATDVDENDSGAVIGNLSTTDPDVGDSFTYTVDDARFEVVDGQLKLKDGQSLDAEAAATVDVTVTSTDSGGASTQQTFTLNVADIEFEAPSLAANDVVGAEDTAIALDLSASLTDAPSGYELSVTIGDVPTGAVLSAGTDNGDGTWTLTADDLDGLTITPPENSDADFTLTVDATMVEVPGGGTIDVDNYDDTSSGFQLTARSINDDGSLSDATVDNVYAGGRGIGVKGNTGTSGASNELGYATAQDQSEELIVDFDNPVSSVSVDFDWLAPNEGGAGSDELGTWQAYSNGVLVGQGTIEPGSTMATSLDISLDGGGTFDQLVFGAVEYSGGADGTADSSDYYITSLTYQEAPSEEGVATTATTFGVAVTSVNDAPTAIILDNASISENDTGGVIGNLSTTDPDVGDSFTYTVDDARFEVVDGQLKLKDGQTLDAETQATVAVTVTSTDSGGASTQQVFTIAVADEIVDIPLLSANDVSGQEGTPIALELTSALQDAGANQFLTVTIADVPPGATLSAGTDNGDGTWTLTADQLAGLTLTPPDGSQSDFSLSVTAQAYEAFDNSGQIDTANYADTSSGFTVTGRTINPDGTLSDASVDNVTAFGDGLGVAGATGGSAEQLGYDASKGVSEQLIVDFDDAVSSATIECRRLIPDEGGSGHDEVGTWTAYHDGVEVGSGDIDPTSGSSITFDIDLGADVVFDQIVFTANEYSNGQNTTNDASDFFVTSIDYTGEVRTGEVAETTITFDVTVDGDLLTGTGASETLSGDAGADEILGMGGDDNIYGAGGDDLLYGGDGTDIVYGGDGADTIVFGEGDGTDNVFGGDGGGWTDVLTLQNADGSAVGSGWTLNLTEGSIEDASDSQVTLSDDAAGTVTLEDGSQVDFSGIEQINW